MSKLIPKRKGRYLKESGHQSKTGRVVLLLGLGVLIAGVVIAFYLGHSRQGVYQMLVRHGYTGTQEQLLASLVGEEVDTTGVRTAYELACENGYQLSEEEWLETLIGVKVDTLQKSPYQLACENGFEGTLVEWLMGIADDPEALGKSGEAGKKTEYELACEYGYAGTFIEWLVSVTHDRVFE